MSEKSTIDEKLNALSQEGIDSLHGYYRINQDEVKRREIRLKREDAPMWAVLKDEMVAEKIQEVLFPLKATIEDIRWDSSFRSVMNNNMGGGIPYAICKQILNVMEKQDELNPLTEQDLFVLEENRKRDPEFTFFYDLHQENGYLSNWYISCFIVDGRVYTSTEQFMMNYKAVLFKDFDSASEIMKTDDLMTIKNLGKRVKNYDDHIWDICRQLVLEEGLRAKFRQNKEIKQMLLHTGDTILAECAKNDLIWGIGKSLEDDTRFDMTLWRGENRLGKALMKIRAELR